MGEVGSVYINFALWAISLVPAWFVIKEIGVSIGKVRDIRKQDQQGGSEEVVAKSEL